MQTVFTYGISTSTHNLVLDHMRQKVASFFTVLVSQLIDRWARAVVLLWLC